MDPEHTNPRALRRKENLAARQLHIWQESKRLYTESCRVLRGLPSSLRRISSPCIGSTERVHIEIAHGFDRGSLHEYMRHLNYALAFLGRTVSAFREFQQAGHVDRDELKRLIALAMSIEKNLLKVIACFESQKDISWSDDRIIKGSNALSEL